MKVTCSTKDIAVAVAAASKIVNGHSTVPILSNVLVVADGSGVRVRGTDLEVTLERDLPGEVSLAGAVTVPAKLFSSYLGNLPPGIVELTGSPTRASIRAEGSNYDFHALPADEFPPMPAATDSVLSFSVDAELFRAGVQDVVFAASRESARGAVLMGTLVEVDDKNVTLVATDGYRLAKWVGKLLEPLSRPPMKFIVPSRALVEASRNSVASETLTFSSLGLQSNQLRMSAGATTLFVRLVDGQYPNYQQVMPAKFDRTITLNSAALMGALDRARLMSGRSSGVNLSIGDGELTITATSDSAGNAYEEIEIEQTGPDISVSVNAAFLAEIVDHVDSPRTVLELGAPQSPILVRPAERNALGELVYVLMPLAQ